VTKWLSIFYFEYVLYIFQNLKKSVRNFGELKA